jgi:hypothetical protein
MAFALNQLTLKVYRLHIVTQKGKIPYRALRLVRKIWKFSKKLGDKPSGGRVGEALDRVGPESLLDSGRPEPPKKGGLYLLSPRPSGRGLRKQEWTGSPGPGPGPKHPVDR